MMNTITPLARYAIHSSQVERSMTDGGPISIHPDVVATYFQRRYDARPKTEEEAHLRGERDFNGIVSSFVTQYRTIEHDGLHLEGELFTTRFFVGRAYRDLVSSGRYTLEQLEERSPTLTGVQLLMPVKRDDTYHLLAQVCDVRKAGTLACSSVGGHVDGRHMQHSDPLLAALSDEIQEEIGLTIDDVDLTPFCYLVEERSLGHMGFLTIAKMADLNLVLTEYEAFGKRMFAEGKQMEANALALIPLDVFPESVELYRASAKGLLHQEEEQSCHPLSQIVIEYLQEKENKKRLLELAGF